MLSVLIYILVKRGRLDVIDDATGLRMYYHRYISRVDPP